MAKRLHIPLEWLQETIELLEEKKQIVLYGPPGTGKTYLAREIARFLTTLSGGQHRLVQFHPSYAYEDFIEGFRPRAGTTPGTVSFEVEDGPLKLIAKQASENPAAPHVLIIDELNRANLAKVFGELYFLLEYRNHSMRLQYSPATDFRLPGNLYIIGTMNTEDRSIAIVDAAMRRRFAWQALTPGEPPVEGMLRSWLTTNGLPQDRADLLDELNARIGDPDAAIGPSYLMSMKVGTEQGLQRIWKHNIMPLLRERHTGDDIDLHGRYGIDALRARTGAPARGTPAVIRPAEETGDAVS